MTARFLHIDLSLWFTYDAFFSPKNLLPSVQWQTVAEKWIRIMQEMSVLQIGFLPYYL